jgi:DNA segregation ATPase FtsK/SpoIIIE, S-DNA-T family
VRVSVRTGPVRWEGALAAVGWLLGRLLVGVWRLIYVAVCRPRAALALLGVIAVGWAAAARTTETVALLGWTVASVEGWALAHRSSWRRHGSLRVLAWWRSLVVYRRSWRAAMHAAELTRADADGQLQVPRLGRVQCRDDVDVVHVRGLLGQRFGMWEEAGPMLAHTFGARDVRVHRGDDRRLTLELLRGRRGRSWNRDGRLDLEQREAA